MSFYLNRDTGRLCENGANLYLMCFATAVLLQVNNLASGTDLNAGWEGVRGRGRGPPWRGDCRETRRYSGTSFVTLSSWEHRKYFRLHKKIFHLTRMTAKAGARRSLDDNWYSLLRLRDSDTDCWPRPGGRCVRGTATATSGFRQSPTQFRRIKYSTLHMTESWTICLPLAAQILITKASTKFRGYMNRRRPASEIFIDEQTAYLWRLSVICIGVF